MDRDLDDGAVGSALSLTAIRAIYSAFGGNGLPYWIRDPCGAWRASSTTLVARHTERAWQRGLGLSIGMVGALGVGQLLGSVLVGTDAIDPPTLFAVAGLLAVVRLCASFIPARRAMRLDPAAVLRSD
jgi:hypothetical protein